MNSWVIAMMLGASITLGAFGLWALIWGLRTGQFDDQNKFLDGALYDDEESLQDAVMLEERKKNIKERKAKEKGYGPPD
ncbi:MAG: cbb3-type cytochrome oxidase assembly protein CcoS [Sulfurospirillaceae bacterium]|nr:cbb3-type cytochrome oxidase assembly protein CcoS [Sulfurospirillaceae bacterium]